ncbi:MAG: hypothetical protein JHC33_12325 [Ignisphaera sp.]|nr:hypothetical protein [Ignisphaera sp.]
MPHLNTGLDHLSLEEPNTGLTHLSTDLEEPNTGLTHLSTDSTHLSTGSINKINNPLYTRHVAKTLSKLLGVDFVPGGIYDFTKQPKRQIDAKRSNNGSWGHSYTKNDTVAKHYLNGNYVVIDVDSASALSVDDEWPHIVTINNKQMALPRTLYTNTTAQHKRHYYYRIPTHTIYGNSIEPSDFMVRIVDTESGVDILGYGIVFEGHASEHNNIHINDISTLPKDIVDYILSNNNNPHNNINRGVVVSSQPGRAKIISGYVENSVVPSKVLTAIIKAICPVKYIKDPSKRSLTLNDIVFNHMAINGIATKLTTIGELGHTQHTIPIINAILEHNNIDPASVESQKRLNGIFATLPTHEPIDYIEENATKSLYELYDRTEGNIAVFEISVKNREYIYIDKLTDLPIPISQNDKTSFGRSITSLEGDFPQYRRYKHNGDVYYEWPIFPMAELAFDFYGPRALNSTSSLNRLVINTYTPPRYRVEVQPRHNTNNPIHRAVVAMFSKQYTPFMLHWMAYAIFSRRQLMAIPVILSKEQGTGKTTLLLTLMHHLTGAFYKLDTAMLASGWADPLKVSVGLGLDDPDLSVWERNTYPVLKGITNGSPIHGNMKGRAIETFTAKVALTITTNKPLPLIDPDDRRLACFEPAYLHNIEEPLSEDDQVYMRRIGNSSLEYDETIQDFMNHLYHIYTTSVDPVTDMPRDKEMSDYLFYKVPDTPFRMEWITGSSTHSKNLYNFIPYPDKLLGLIKSDINMVSDVLADHIEMIVISAHTISGDINIALSWHWFRDMLPLVTSKTSDRISKGDVSAMLGKEPMINVGDTYTKLWANHSNEELRKHTAAGYKFKITEEAMDTYRSTLEKLRAGYSII